MILVTGATGLVGGNLLWYLLQENERVLAIRRSTSNMESLRRIFSYYTPKPEDYLARIDWETGDVLDFNSILNAMQKASIVYHCAAKVSLSSNETNLSDTNVLGTKNIVNAALQSGVKKLCFVSSIAACGKAAFDKLIDEESVWDENSPRSMYSQSKYDSEQEIWKGIKLGLNAVIVNPGVILGISGNESGSSQLFAQVRKGLIFYINGGSGYVDVQDVVKAMIMLTKSEISGERFVLVSENCSNKEILNWMADGFNNRKPFIRIGKRMLLLIGWISEVFGKIFHFQPIIDRRMARTATHREYYSSQKIKDALSFQFTPIQKCITQICDFQLQKQQRFNK